MSTPSKRVTGVTGVTGPSDQPNSAGGRRRRGALDQSASAAGGGAAQNAAARRLTAPPGAWRECLHTSPHPQRQRRPEAAVRLQAFARLVLQLVQVWVCRGPKYSYPRRPPRSARSGPKYSPRDPPPKVDPGRLSKPEGWGLEPPARPEDRSRKHAVLAV